ncbi:MAG: beta-phosphoglucomutase [Cellulomonadaceae bacterium]|nr:beta-phosphoglucomutase [Cellulomonadaceae bacterium]
MCPVNTIRAVIFDLDGVLVHTDHFHFVAWKELADRNGWAFDESLNEQLRGVSRLESLDIILRANGVSLPAASKATLAEDKNTRYRELLASLGPCDVDARVLGALEALRRRGYRLAVGSSSRNAPFIIERLDIQAAFEVVVDGSMIERSKPDPEVFERAAHLLGLPTADCAVVEDAVAGVDAARAAGCWAIAVVESAAAGADCYLDDLANLPAVLGGASASVRPVPA